jgi:hypothetical protein
VTQTSKMVSRKVAATLAILCIATLVGLNISIITYYTQINEKNHQIQTLNSQITDIQTQIANITTPEPRLVSIGMQLYDNRTDQNAAFLKITGYVCNVGTGTANNCKLHLVAIQKGNLTAIDTEATINSLPPGVWREVDLEFFYKGEPLIAYTTNLDWTT